MLKEPPESGNSILVPERVYKPSSVSQQQPARTATIPLERQLPAASSGLPEGNGTSSPGTACTVAPSV